MIEQFYDLSRPKCWTLDRKGPLTLCRAQFAHAGGDSSDYNQLKMLTRLH